MNKKIKKIEDQFDVITKIDLSEEYSLLVVPEIIKDCLRLEKLDLSFSGIEEIPDFIFNLPRLKELNLSGCKNIKKLPSSFTSTQSLEKLSIHVGEKHEFPKEIASLKHLKSISISGNLRAIPISILHLDKLEELELIDTKISTLPKEIKELKSLRKFSLSQALFSSEDKPTHLNLEEIFENLSSCNRLKEINLNRNGIKVIPANIKVLKGLRKFSAHDNILESFPIEIYELPNLILLDLGVNRIREVPRGIKKLRKLQVLKLNSNWKNSLNTTALFDEISELQDLEVLELWSCQSIKELPEEIASLKKLKKIDVDNNLLTSLPMSICDMTQLKVLRVSTNKIPIEIINCLKEKLTKTKIIA